MKPRHAAVIMPLFFAACSSTTVRDRSGHARFHTQADVSHLEFHSADGDSLVMDAVNHSTPTRAGGSVIGTAGASAMGVLAAGMMKP